MKKYDTLYHLDENINVRVWWMEQDGNRYRTVSGIEDGNLVTSGWTTVKGKNIGRANETQPDVQAASEIESKYTKKKKMKYHTSKDTISAGAHYFEPMLAEGYKKFKWAGNPVFSQPKLDGARCIATKDGLFSRTGEKFVSVPHIEQILAPIFATNPSLILDGELYNHDLKDDFNQLMSMIRKQKNITIDDAIKARDLVQYHVYDAPSLKETFLRRSLTVQEVVTILNHSSIIAVRTDVCTNQDDLDGAYGEYLGDGYEGQIIRLDAQYENKRSKVLIKRKEFIDAEFPLDEIQEGNGNWAGLAKHVVYVLPDGRTASAGIRGTKEFAKDLLMNKSFKWVTIRYQNLSPDGIPRFAIATAFYEKERTI